jgi:hypothetical protein
MSDFLDYSTLKVGSIGCPETSIRNYHYALRNIPEQHRSQVGMKWYERALTVFIWLRIRVSGGLL